MKTLIPKDLFTKNVECVLKNCEETKEVGDICIVKRHLILFYKRRNCMFYEIGKNPSTVH